jgi:hypothetical protein
MIPKSHTTQSVEIGIPTRSVGTSQIKADEVKSWQAERAKYPEGKPTEKK